MEDQYKDAIIEAIPAIKSQSKRLDGELISKQVAFKYGLDQNRAMEIIEKLLAGSIVYIKVNKLGKESFYISKGSAECETQDESILVSNNNFCESIEIPSTPSGEEACDSHLYDYRSCSKEPHTS